ncbi:MAG: zinc-ribbon domain containing protein [Alphaproteobacteria bacterium]|nr:zinc-ribbon domain containing protein [Alphaproteobacteria bacterium]MCB9793596.1 zinc-ribbon domain containing protein [Alphaproteobacteria bacterium]
MGQTPRTSLWLHPHAPAEVSRGRPSRVHWGYSEGANPADFEEVASVQILKDPWRLQGAKLHRYGIVADPSKQLHGWGGAFWFYADFTRRCVGCRQDFVFTAEAQRFWYEELGAWCDSVAIRCEACRKDRRHARVANRRWQEALQAWQAGPPGAALASALAEAGMTLIEVEGGGARILDDCVGALRAGIAAEPADPTPLAWLARVELARGRGEAAVEQGQAYLSRTEQRRDKGTKALRKAVERDLARVRQEERLI